jgi:hypothetical protein
MKWLTRNRSCSTERDRLDTCALRNSNSRIVDSEVESAKQAFFETLESHPQRTGLP